MVHFFLAGLNNTPNFTACHHVRPHLLNLNIVGIYNILVI